jgi:hypothetical protein
MSAWNRREFDVSIAGYFTVLRPTRWFSALRLPEGFRYRIKGAEPENPALASKLPPAPGSISSPKLNSADHTAGPETAIPFQLTTLSTPDRHLARLALIVPAGIAITVAALWWAIWSQH